MALSDILQLEESTAKAYDPKAGNRAFASSLLSATLGEIDRRRKEKEVQAKNDFEMAKLDKLIGGREDIANVNSLTALQKQKLADEADKTIALINLQKSTRAKELEDNINTTIAGLSKAEYITKGANYPTKIYTQEDATIYARAKQVDPKQVDPFIKLYPTKEAFQKKVDEYDTWAVSKSSAKEKAHEFFKNEISSKALELSNLSGKSKSTSTTTKSSMRQDLIDYEVGKIIKGNDGRNYKIIKLDPKDPTNPDVELVP